MRLSRGLLLSTLVLLLCSSLFALDLETIVIASEDEIDEAFSLGEIDLDQYLLLKEIIVHGIDSTTLFLLDDIHNLSHFLVDTTVLVVALEDEQENVIHLQEETTQKKRGVKPTRLSYQYRQGLEDEDSFRYRTSVDAGISNRLRLSFKLNREESGRERVVSRSLKYSSSSGIVRRVTVGSFTARLGLGTLFGYRGKLLRFSDNIDGESFAYPDYGGYNGLYTVLKSRMIETQLLASVVRDKVHRVTSLGALVQLGRSRFRPGVIVGYNRIRNRMTEKTIGIPMYGLYTDYRYSSGYTRIEISRQASGQIDALAAIAEGRHRFNLVETRWAGWIYSDEYPDLTGGGKSASITQSFILQPVDFDFSSRRTGQAGVLLKTTVQMAEQIALYNSLLFASVHGDHTNTELASGFQFDTGSDLELQLDYLGKWRKRTTLSGIDDSEKNRLRAEGRFHYGEYSLRSYIAFNSETDRGTFFTLFAGGRYEFAHDGKIEFYSNINRITEEGVGYWYAYVLAEQRLWDGYSGGVKLMHTYRDSGDDHNEAAVSFELRAVL